MARIEKWGGRRRVLIDLMELSRPEVGKLESGDIYLHTVHKPYLRYSYRRVALIDIDVPAYTVAWAPTSAVSNPSTSMLGQTSSYKVYSVGEIQERTSEHSIQALIQEVLMFS